MFYMKATGTSTWVKKGVFVGGQLSRLSSWVWLVDTFKADFFFDFFFMFFLLWVYCLPSLPESFKGGYVRPSVTSCHFGKEGETQSFLVYLLYSL